MNGNALPYFLILKPGAIVYSFTDGSTHRQRKQLAKENLYYTSKYFSQTFEYGNEPLSAAALFAEGQCPVVSRGIA